ncbi:hypothetical protein MRB53_035550 [Persea americana]|uniref:Uncharacterized protein n=1 Tax=Persea americana TaxID=3435 RepID=A0ACC2K4X9_PERAE|nr:hypothetical protein MRB53_035550 [Persea americana]
MEEDGYKVSLNVYDLTQGLAGQLSATFLGKAIEGVWHTGVVVYGNEYFFGGGIQHSPAGATPYGTPVRVVDLGVTHVPKDLFEEYLQEISPRYTAETYSLISHNCNNFSNEVAQFLVGTTVPDYILQLPNEVMNSPMGALIMPMIQRLEMTMSSGAIPQAPQLRSHVTDRPPQPKTSVSTPTTSVSSKLSASHAPVNNAADDPTKSDSGNIPKKVLDTEVAVPPAIRPAEMRAKNVNGVSRDPLEKARSKVQEEIGKEFAAIMAAGTLGASEAAALATRRVMERHGMKKTASPTQLRRHEFDPSKEVRSEFELFAVFTC